MYVGYELIKKYLLTRKSYVQLSLHASKNMGLNNFQIVTIRPMLHIRGQYKVLQRYRNWVYKYWWLVKYVFSYCHHSVAIKEREIW